MIRIIKRRTVQVAVIIALALSIASPLLPGGGTASATTYGYYRRP